MLRINLKNPYCVSTLDTVLRYCPFWNRTTSTPWWIEAFTFLTGLLLWFRTHMFIAICSPCKYNWKWHIFNLDSIENLILFNFLVSTCLSKVSSSSSSPGLKRKSFRTTVHGWFPCLLGANWIFRIANPTVLLYITTKVSSWNFNLSFLEKS